MHLNPLSLGSAHWLVVSLVIRGLYKDLRAGKVSFIFKLVILLKLSFSQLTCWMGGKRVSKSTFQSSEQEALTTDVESVSSRQE